MADRVALYTSEVEVTLIDVSAADRMVAQAARVSTLGIDSAKESRFHDGNLIDYLMRNRHGSPFEHNHFTFLIEAPIFTAREHMRHRSGWSYNEESGRYRELDPVFFMPDPERDLVQVGKPGHYDFEPGTDDQRYLVKKEFTDSYMQAWGSYRKMLEAGIAKEVARSVLPLGIHTSYYATCNARSLMHFLSLRTKKPNAKFPSSPQQEIQMVADKMEALFKGFMPITWNCFHTYGRMAP